MLGAFGKSCSLFVGRSVRNLLFISSLAEELPFDTGVFLLTCSSVDLRIDPLHSLYPFPKGSSQFGQFAQQVRSTADKLEKRFCDKNPMCLQVLHTHAMRIEDHYLISPPQEFHLRANIDLVCWMTVLLCVLGKRQISGKLQW